MIDSQIILERFKVKHGDKYDYTHAKINGTRTKIIIICREHGEFLQLPHDHYHGRGCPLCFADKNKDTLDQVVYKCKLSHGDTYDYTGAKLDRTKLSNVRCRVHGDFHINKDNHIKGHGCKRCAGAALSVRKTTDVKARLLQVVGVHGVRYDYSNVTSGAGKAKIDIICPLHGVFSQTWHNHLNGQGCPSCKIVGRYSEQYFLKYPNRKNMPAVLYLLRMNDGDTVFYKIGISIDIENRLKAIPYNTARVLVKNYELYDAFTVEQEFLKTYGYCNRYTPKIHFGGDKECFILPEREILQALPSA